MTTTMAVATVRRILIQGPGTVWIPRKVALCPECRGQLVSEIFEWDAKTGEPTWPGVAVYCCKEPATNEPGETHHNWDSDWQPVLDKVIAWCRANVRIVKAEGGMLKYEG